MVDNIKITALTSIGANIAYTTLVPVVNMTGTPLTQKATAQDLGNLILSGAGGSYFTRAAQSNLALSVANAAQPNITSVGSLTSLTVTGNITTGNINGANIVAANFFSGDGGFLTNVYSNSSVANYLPTYTGNLSAGNLNVTGNVSAGNLLGIFANGNSSVRIPAANGNVNISAVGNANILIVTGIGVNVTGTLNTTGNSNVGNLGTAQVLATANITAPQLISNVTTGTAPFVVTSTTQVANLSVATAGTATSATTAGTVTTAAQPNITSVGTLSTATITTGNITTINSGLLQNGNSNVTITANGNVNVSAASTANWTFGTNGVFYLAGNTVAINFANGSAAFSNMVEWTASPIANTSAGTAGQAAYDAGGNLYVCVATNTWSKFSGTTSW